MNVVCSRCSTKYEFDDALVSRRGTSVKCTNCGHKFRVYPPTSASAGAPDQWLIRTARGQNFRFESLRDLQRALGDGRVTVADAISRDGRTFRPIHSVPELESFFPNAAKKRERAPQTLTGVQAPEPSSPIPRPASAKPQGAPPPNYEEDDVTSVYSSEQLEKLKPPMRSPPPFPVRTASRPAMVPRTSASPLQAGPAGASHTRGPSKLTPSPIQVPKAPAAPIITPRGAGGAQPVPGRGSIAGGNVPRPSSTTPRPTASVSSKPVSAPKPAVGPAGGALPGTPTISLTGENSQVQLKSAEIDTVRPPPGTPEGEAGLATSAAGYDDEAPTQVGDLNSMLGKSAEENAAISERGRPPEPPTPQALAPTEHAGGLGRPRPDEGQMVSPSPAAVTPDVVATPPGAALPAPPEPERSASPQEAPPPMRRRAGGRRAIAEGDGAAPAMDADRAPELDPEREALEDFEDFPESTQQPARSNLRWVFGLLLVAGVGLAAVTLGKGYLAPFLKSDTAGGVADARVDSLVQAGHELYRQGDIEGAKEQFDRASGIAENHPGVVEGSLLVKVARCDLPWLEARLYPEGSPARSGALDRLGRCSKTLDDVSNRAVAFADQNPMINALLIDSYRIRGQVPAARQRAAGLTGHAAEPKAAYALAMLDLADDDPGWSTVIERLRLAFGGERSPGRANAALIYALARSGDVEAARVEVSNMDAASRRHPLISQLAAFVETSPGEEASGEEEEIEGSAPAGGEPSSAAEEAEPNEGAGDAEPGSGDPLKRARAARRSGDKAKAERYYQEALQLSPGNVEALTGLGDIARARGNSTAALSHYHAALRSNAGHLPALASVADLNWAHGDRAEAVKYYRRIGNGNRHSKRAQNRIAEFEAGGSSPSPREAPETPGGSEQGSETDEPALSEEPSSDEHTSVDEESSAGADDEQSDEPAQPEEDPPDEPKEDPPDEPEPEPEGEAAPIPGPPPGPKPRSVP